MVTMTLYARQQKRHRCIEQSFGLCGRGRGKFCLPSLVISFIYNRVYAAKSFQSCPTLCDPLDGSPPGSPIPRTLQARTLEWVAISFSNA